MLGARPRLFTTYIAGVSALGAALFIAVLTVFQGLEVSEFGWPFVVLLPFVVVGERYPLRVPRGADQGVITVSTTFAFAILLSRGTAAAMLALTLSSVAADILLRKPAWKVLFNAAQMTTSVVTAGAVLGLLTGGAPFGAPIELGTRELPAALLAAAAFYGTNVLLTVVAVAWGTQASVIDLLRRDLRFQALTAAVLLSLSPIVAAAADRSLALVPLFVVSMAAVYKSVAIYLEREFQALHDPLTGLPNRGLFTDRVEQAIVASTRLGRRTAVMMIDLDGFKEVNDTLGHPAGDRLLSDIGRRLESTLRQVDTVARLGGDEYGVVLWNVADADAVDPIVTKLRAVIESPFTFGDVTLGVEGSVGVALTPEHGDDAESLIRHADAAMYEAKRTRSGHRVYSGEDSGQTTRMTLIVGLREAIEQGSLVLHYQPKVTLRTGQTLGVEALVRWDQPGRGLVAPDAFIPLAEQTGLMGKLTRYVLDAALAQNARWRRRGLDLRVAVNISARDLQDPGFPALVDGLLRRWELEPWWVELEITESAIMSDPTRALDVLTQLHRMGVVLALDDFGTGTTSLTQLQHLPVDVIKIDKSFVVNLVAGAPDEVIVRTIIDLGRGLGLEVVAEGVESEFLWDRLGSFGCDVAQGFYLSAPVPAAELEAWMAASGRR